MLAFGIGKRSCIGEVFARSRMLPWCSWQQCLSQMESPCQTWCRQKCFKKHFYSHSRLKLALSYDQNSIRKTYLEASVYINSIRKTKDVVHVHYHDLSYICILKTSISNNHTVSIEKNRWKNPNGKHVTSTFCFLKFIVKTLSCKNLIKYKLIMTYPKYIISLTYMYNYQIKARWKKVCA